MYSLQVRSSKQDQIHNSIVSTLLALMDGLDARGQVRDRVAGCIRGLEAGQWFAGRRSWIGWGRLCINHVLPPPA